MSKNTGPGSAFGRDDSTSLAGEILGAPVTFPASAQLAAPVRGTLIDETLSTFVVRVPGRARAVRVPKSGALGTIVLDGRELSLRGDTLRVRPEDRTKRLLARGPRRFR